RRSYFPDYDLAVDPCSWSYWAGNLAPLVVGGGRLAYAGIAKAASLGGSAAIAAGADAVSVARVVSSTRNALKVIFRGGFFRNFRNYPFEAMLTKYGDPAIIIAKAGTTDNGLTAAGAAIYASGEINRRTAASRCCRRSRP